MKTAVMFSGAAGTSVGARQAGASIVWAANHNRLCVDVHQANFPEARNVCQDLHLFNHAAMDKHDLLLASPVCRASSKASRPGRATAAEQGDGSLLASAHNAYRALPWSVIDALEVNRPDTFVVENVPDWREWVFYKDFLRMTRTLGYKVTEQVLDSAAWGVPQSRERLFVIGTLGPKPIRVADPSGGRVASMGEFVDWDDGEWLPFSACHGDKMRAQLEQAHAEFGGGPAFVNLVSHRPVYSAAQPLRTATRQDQYRWVRGGQFRYPSAREAFSLMGFPSDYVIPDAVAKARTVAWSMAGDAVCPQVMRGIVAKVLAARE